MAELKLGNIKPVGADNVVVESKYVKGGYVVVTSIAERDALKGNSGENIIKGSLCYCTADSKFYQYNGTAWVEKEFGAAASQSTAGLMSKDDKTKLDGIAAGAEVNVQADWDVTETTSDAFIKNKPTIPTKSSWNYDDRYVKYSEPQSLSDAQKTQARANIGAGTSNFSGDYDDLTNTPTIPTGAAAEKDVDTSISASSTSTNLPTSKAVAAFVEGKGYKTTDNNTTYTFATGDSNGQIKVTPSSGTAQNVSVKGLGTAAYTNSNAYMAADDTSHGTHVTAATVKSALGTGTGTSKYLREDGTWVTPPNTTYSEATADAPGLMSKTDKANLDTLTEMLVDGETTVDTIREVLEVFSEYPEETTIVNALAGKSKVGHTHEVTTKNAAPHTHTHNVTVSGTTGTNSGTAVTAVTGYESFSGGTGALTSNTATDGIKYVEAISSTAASLTGTKTFNTDAIKDVTLTASSVSSDGPAYVESVSHTAATLGGTKTFNTDAIKSVSLSASTSSTDGPAYVEAISGGSGSLTADTASADGIAYVASISSTGASASGTAKAGSETHTHTYTKTTGVNLGSNTTATDGVKYLEALSGGSGSLKSYDASSGGNAKTSSGRVPYIADVSHTAATLTGTTTFVTGVSGGSGSLTTDANSTNGIAYVSAQGTFSAGTTPVSSAAPTHTSIASGSSSGTTDTIASYSAGVLTIKTTVNSGAHTHTYDKTTGITLTRGTAPSLGAATTKYLHHSHTAASASGTGTVEINGGSISKTTYYLDHTHTGASGTTKYFHPVITTESVSSGAPSATATFVTGVTGGTASATTKYLHHTHTAPGATTKYMKAAGTAASKGTVTISGGSITPVTKYMKRAITAASTGTVGISGGSTNATTKYLHHTHTAASLGSPSTASVAPSGHKHSYGSSTALTTGNNSGTAVAAVTAISASTN